ncbi:hypothetical protein O4328_43445 [Rhodococcus opacus]|uniref:Transposase n=1 Tax=Rhodococcus opacus TaxID=37919 RepID=A0ABT4NVF9_RHOOP|nr:hypothetical protein [Rhodococcus opacus]MCZ4590397.1 hypothetical protein [Rhodococcus opacus]
MRSDRVLCFPAPPPGRTGPPRHRPEFRFADPITWPALETTSSTETDRYGTASASAWNRLHPLLVHRGSWAQDPGPPPIVEGTVIRLTVDHLPGDRHPTRCGCGARTRASVPTNSTGCGSCFCGASISSTPSDSSSRRWGGPHLGSAVPSRPTAGPESCWWPMPNSGSPVLWPRTYAARGNGPSHQHD